MATAKPNADRRKSRTTCPHAEGCPGVAFKDIDHCHRSVARCDVSLNWNRATGAGQACRGKVIPVLTGCRPRQGSGTSGRARCTLFDGHSRHLLSVACPLCLHCLSWEAHQRPWRNWIAHRSSKPRVTGSNPVGRTSLLGIATAMQSGAAWREMTPNGPVGLQAKALANSLGLGMLMAAKPAPRDCFLAGRRLPVAYQL